MTLVAEFAMLIRRWSALKPCDRCPAWKVCNCSSVDCQRKLIEHLILAGMYNRRSGKKWLEERLSVWEQADTHG